MVLKRGFFWIKIPISRFARKSLQGLELCFFSSLYWFPFSLLVFLPHNSEFPMIEIQITLFLRSLWVFISETISVNIFLCTLMYRNSWVPVCAHMCVMICLGMLVQCVYLSVISTLCMRWFHGQDQVHSMKYMHKCIRIYRYALCGMHSAWDIYCSVFMYDVCAWAYECTRVHS